MKKLLMGAMATLFLAGTSFAGVTPKAVKAPAKQETKSDKKSEKKEKTKSTKKTTKGDAKTTTAKPKEEKPK